MGRTIGELMDSMSSQEFAIWLALYEEDQWGDKRHDLRAGMIAAAVGNYAGKIRKEQSKPLTAADFFQSLADIEPQKEPDPTTFFTAVATSKTFNK